MTASASRQFLLRTVAAAALGFGICAAASPLQAAEEPQVDDLQELDLGEVAVTGTRIVREDYVSPNPIQTLDVEQLERLNIVNISDAITQVPANVSTFQARNQGSAPFFVGSTIANLRGLNPFFGTRTLTLIDSHRFVPTNQGQSVDLNVVPALLVNRLEVVTGGASAAYGSDAVSGVVNVILDKRLKGVKLEADYGVTQRGDGDNYHLGMAAGTSLFEGRGHLIFGAEYQNSRSIDDCSAARSWCAKSNGLLINGGSGYELPAADGTRAPYVSAFTTPALDSAMPQRFRASNLRLNQVNAYGVIFNGTSGAANTLSANAAGTGTGNFAIGQYGTVGPFQTAIGGDGAPLTSITSLMPEIKRVSTYSRLSFDLTDSTEIFAEASYADVDAFVTQGGPGFVVSAQCVSSDNAYLSGAFGTAVLGAAGNDNRPAMFGGCAASQTLVSKDWNTQINRNVTTGTATYRGLVGLEGRLGESTWNWDAYYQHGQTRRTQILQDNNTVKQMAMALDAVIDNRAGSATFGQAVCRVTRDGVTGFPVDPIRVALAAGCVPLNPFGNQPLTQAQRAYAFGDLSEENVITQDVLAANVSGRLWDGWGAGPLSAAAGVEYRAEKLTNDAGDETFYQRTDYAAQYGDPFAGHTQVKEGYVELEMGLLKDQPFARDVRVNLATRRTSYKTRDDLFAINPDSKVNVTTRKLGLVWDPLDWLRFRGSRSRDLRAAGFRELYYSLTIPEDPANFLGGVANPWMTGPFGPAFDGATITLSGNSSLKPEKATTTTIGMVLSPAGWVDGMHFAIDWYRIKLVDGISSGVAATTVERCYQGNAFYCSLITGTRGGTPNPATGQQGFSDITSLRAPYENGRPYRAEGLDINWDHLIALKALFEGAPGSITLRLSATRALKTEVDVLQYPNYITKNVVGQVGAPGFLADYAPTPKWLGNFTVSYLNGPASVTLQTQWTGKGKLNTEMPWLDPSDTGYDPALAGTVDDNSVSDYFNFNLSGSYDLPLNGRQHSQLFMNVTNLLDHTPPFTNGGVGGVNGTFYDTLGRSFRVGFRMKF